MAKVRFDFLSVENLDQALGLSTEAGWNQTQEDWEMIVSHPGLHLAAWNGSELIGTTCCLDFQNCTWVAMVLVDSKYRRQGIASYMIERVFEKYPHRSLALDATQIGSKVYERLGFRTGEVINRWIYSGENNNRNKYHATTIPPQTIDKIINLDRKIMHADRSAIFLNIARRKNSFHYINPITNAFVLARAGRLAFQIGPLIAQNSASAIDLLLKTIKCVKYFSIYVDAPERKDWNALLKEQNFTIQRSFIRMHYAEHETPNYKYLFATAGPEVG